MDLWIILSSLLVGCCGIYLHFFRKSNIFHQTGIPHIRPWPILGNMDPVIFQKMSLPRLISSVYSSNLKAKYIGFFEFMTPIIILRDPDIIKSIGIKNFGTFSNRRGFVDETQDPFFGKGMFSLKDEKWHQIRNILSPSFTSSKMKIMFRLMSQKAEHFCNHILEGKTEEVEIRKSFQKLIADIIATCSYGISTNCVEDPKNELYVFGLRGVNNERSLRLRQLALNFPRLWKIFSMKFIDSQVENFFRNIVDSTITARKENKIFRPDMLHLMMDAHEKNKSDEKKELSIEEMTAQVFIFFFGSFHTTTAVITFLTYEMALNPKIQMKLQEEIDSVLIKSNVDSIGEELNNEPVYEEINKMRFLDAVIKETMRLHTVAPILERVCSEDFELPPALPGSKPFALKPGMILWIPSEAIHHDPDHYENPDQFDPDRFLKEDEKIVLNSPTFLPFGLGPRGCIAYRFALLIFKVVIFHFFAKCSVKVCPKTPIPLTLCNNTLSNVQKSEIWLRVEERKLCEEKT